MKGALKPVGDIRSVWEDRAKIDAKKKGIDVDDAKLTALSGTAGWGILKEHMEVLKNGLDKRLSESVLGNLGETQIKNDVLFAVLGKELLNSIINKVEDSVEEVNDITSKEQ